MAIKSNRQITVKGDFQRAVIINDTLINGKDCIYDSSSQTSTYSHAEGCGSKATGAFSHADGYKANAEHARSYVWSGTTSDTANASSMGEGTYAIYTGLHSGNVANGWEDGIKQIYINGSNVKTIADYYKQLTLNEVRTSDNTFSGSLNMSSSSNKKSFSLNNKFTLSADGVAIFNNSVTLNGSASVNTPNVTTSTNSNQIASCKFVHDVVQSYLRNIFGDGIFKS